MNKYKIVGTTNLLMGIFSLVIPLISLSFVLPKVTQVYNEFGATSNLTGSYLAIGFGILLGLINLLFAYKLFSTKTVKKDKFFGIGIVTAIGTFFLSGVVSAIISMSALSPIYNLVK